MLALLQRVKNSRVVVAETIIGEIEQGILILCGFQANDCKQTLDKMLYKCLNYRIFSDGKGKMNLSVKDIEGGLLFVPQFTLAANTNKGLRPSFSSSALPTHGGALFSQLKSMASDSHHTVAFGQFGANMQVELCNDGPVTFMLEFN
jgi:D-aminoacyl-tRNA deacylase